MKVRIEHYLIADDPQVWRLVNPDDGTVYCDVPIDARSRALWLMDVIAATPSIPKGTE